MTTNINDTTQVRGVSTLTALRALTIKPPETIVEAVQTTDSQAALLHHLKFASTGQLSAALTELIPNLVIQHSNDLPLPGISFWAGRHWHIHIRASDPIDFQAFTMLHELKHIIDHPHRQANRLTSEIHEALANRFAVRVLAGASHPLAATADRRGSE